jgi:hypothetical protein
LATDSLAVGALPIACSPSAGPTAQHRYIFKSGIAARTAGLQRLTAGQPLAGGDSITRDLHRTPTAAAEPGKRAALGWVLGGLGHKRQKAGNTRLRAGNTRQQAENNLLRVGYATQRAANNLLRAEGTGQRAAHTGHRAQPMLQACAQSEVARGMASQANAGAEHERAGAPRPSSAAKGAAGNGAADAGGRCLSGLLVAQQLLHDKLDDGLQVGAPRPLPHPCIDASLVMARTNDTRPSRSF